VENQIVMHPLESSANIKSSSSSAQIEGMRGYTKYTLTIFLCKLVYLVSPASLEIGVICKRSLLLKFQSKLSPNLISECYFFLKFPGEDPLESSYFTFCQFYKCASPWSDSIPSYKFTIRALSSREFS